MAVWDPQLGGNTHFDVVLSNISVAYPNEGMVGDVLFPTVNVRKQSDKYYLFGREGWGLDPGTDLRAPGTEATEIPGLAVSTDTYWAQEHSLQIAITDEERENVDSPLAPDRDGTELVTGKVLLAREIAIKTMVTTTSNYAAGYSTTLSGTTQWSDYVNSNPISDFKVARDTIHAGLFIVPNLAIIPYQVMSKLEDHPDFIERIKYVQRGVLNQEIIASLLGVPRIIVPGMGYNSANPGQTASIGYMWGKDVVIAYVPPRAAPRQLAFGYEFNMGYGGNRPQIVERWRETNRKSDVIRVSRRYDLKMVTLNALGKQIAGYVIKAAIA
jgi:hypothetical protein